MCDQLVRKGVQVENRCPMCGTEGETLLYIFYECRFNNEVWSMCQPNLPHIEGAMWENMSEWNKVFQRLEDSGVVDLWLIMCWLIWTNRN